LREKRGPNNRRVFMRVVIFSLLLSVLAISAANADVPAASVADHIRHPGQREQRVAWCQTRCQMQFGQQVCNTYCY
jgi:hypothetical protein